MPRAGMLLGATLVMPRLETTPTLRSPISFHHCAILGAHRVKPLHRLTLLRVWAPSLHHLKVEHSPA